MMTHLPTPSPWAYSRLALGYDTSSFELSERVRAGLHAWSPDELRATLAERAAWEKAQREMHVYYYRIYHLIYAGFVVNWCLLMSPGGLVDMNRRGVVCSVLRQAVTADFVCTEVDGGRTAS